MFVIKDFTEAATRGVLCRKVFLEISQNSQEIICAFFKEHLWWLLLILKMSSQKANQNKETENFINDWKKEERFCNVCSPAYKNKNMRHKSIKSLMTKFTMTGK